MGSGVDPSVPMEDRIKGLQQILIARATGVSARGEAGGLARCEYEALRRDLLTNPSFAPLMPQWLSDCRDLDRFWSFIKAKFTNYEERRQFIWKAFESAFARLEGRSVSPADEDVAAALADLSSETVQRIWQAALRRRGTDPEGAITTSRTLVETICKHILTERQVPFEEDANLTKLYGLTARSLDLAPDQHTEQLFKQILGGCKAVVDGMGALRNRLSDSHGKRPNSARPESRHAELAVNLAGAMATFLVQTWRRQPSDK